MSSDEDNSKNTNSSSNKPFSSNHYAWASNINATRQELQRLGVDNTPKPINISSPSSTTTSSSAISSTTASSTTTNNVASAWNAAGTW